VRRFFSLFYKTIKVRFQPKIRYAFAKVNKLALWKTEPIGRLQKAKVLLALLRHRRRATSAVRCAALRAHVGHA
jgi:hypothetical protein